MERFGDNTILLRYSYQIDNSGKVWRKLFGESCMEAISLGDRFNICYINCMIMR